MKLIQIVTEYVEFKQALGVGFQSEARTLKAWCRTQGEIDIREVEPDTVLSFIAGMGAVTSFWHYKFKVLTGFYRFAMSRDYIDSSPLPTATPKSPEPLSPYVYTLEELRRLLAATAILETPMSSLQAATFRALLLVLYGTGLRISEALALTLADVDLPQSLIVVRNTKFFKTRLVPIGPKLTSELCTYAKRRRRLPLLAGKNSPFFATRTGNNLSYERASKIFRILRCHAHVHRESGARYQPRIHDIRHTFAVHRLVAWYRQGADVQHLLPYLSTYLGHVDIEQTQRYLSMTTNLLREASRRFEQYTLSEVKYA